MGRWGQLSLNRLSVSSLGVSPVITPLHYYSGALIPEPAGSSMVEIRWHISNPIGNAVTFLRFEVSCS